MIMDEILKALLDAHGVKDYDVIALDVAKDAVDEWAHVYSCGCM